MSPRHVPGHVHVIPVFSVEQLTPFGSKKIQSPNNSKKKETKVVKTFSRYFIVRTCPSDMSK